jgi:hypothetical protein
VQLEKFNITLLVIKIYAFFDFYNAHLIIHLILKICENIIYFIMRCFIIVYILNIS